MLFSDIQKKIVPFTDDIDLLDARVEALASNQNIKGSSNMGQALSESISYFRNSEGEISGNILMFSDAEANEEDFNLKIPDGVTVAVVGVGTAKGGPIPQKTNDGRFLGNIKYRGEDAISRLDESFLKKLSSQIKNYKYWIASSYQMPTEEIISFFDSKLAENFSQSSADVRPVYSNYLTLVAVIFMIISFMFKMRNSFILFIIMPVLFFYSPVRAQDNVKQELPKEMVSKLESLKKGELDTADRLNLANDFLKLKKFEEAKTIYQESLDEETSANISDEHLFNYGTSQLATNDVKEGISTMKKLLKKLERSKDKSKEKLAELARENIKKYEKGEDQGKKDEKDKKQDDKKEGENKDQQKKDGKGEQEEKDKKDNKEEKSGENKSKDSKDQKSEEDKKKDEKKESQKSESEKQKEEQEKEQQAKEQQEQKPARVGRSKKPVPAMLKQLIDEDRGLQKKHTDTETNKPQTEQGKKDW